MIDPIHFLQNFVLTLLLGGLIGLERERDHEVGLLKGAWGIRTLALVALLGFLVTFLFGENVAIFGILTLSFAILVVASYVISSVHRKDNGTTTEMAALFVYLIGVLMAMEERFTAVVVALFVVSLLYFKESLHGFANRVESKEIYATLKFIIVVFVILPLLPDQTLGPLNVLNPYMIWLMVVFISTISFVSYIAIRLLGSQKGVGISGFLGGLISSTAVSMSFSELSKKSKKLVSPLAFGIVVATTAMFFRVLIEVSILNRGLLPYISIPMISMGVAGLGVSMYFWLKRKGKEKKVSETDLRLESPFQLIPAIKFAMLFAVLLFVAKFAHLTFGDTGVYFTALISGLVDVDPITISMANLSLNQEIGLPVAAIAITLAVMVNTLVKGGIVLIFGTRALGKKVMLSMLILVGVGLFSILFIPVLNGFAAI